MRAGGVIGLALLTILSATGAGAEMPDVSLDGSLGYTLIETKDGGRGPRTWRNTFTVTASPSTYIYAPWLATVDGTLSFSQNTTVGGASASAQNVTGALSLGILPRSLYPAFIRYSRFDNAVQADEGRDLTATGDSWEVDWRLFLPDDWSVNTKAVFDTATDDGADSSILNLRLAVDKQFEDFQVRTAVDHREETISDGDGTYDYAVDMLEFRTQSKLLPNFSTQDITTLRIARTDDVDYVADNLTWQGVTTGRWQPEFLDGITINGALRTFHQEHTIDGRTAAQENSERVSDTAHLVLSSSFNLLSGLTASIGVNGGTQTSEIASDSLDGATSTQQSLSTGVTGSVNYSYPSIPVLGFNWNWNTGLTASLNNNTLRGMSNEQTARLSHSASRTLDVGISDLRLRASQSIGARRSHLEPMSPLLNHSVGLSSSRRDGRNWQLFELSFSDNRSFGADPSTYQLLNLQTTGGYDIDRFTSLRGNLTVQVSRNFVGGTDSGLTDTISGDVTYSVGSLFGVPGLNFSSSLAVYPPSFLGDEKGGATSHGADSGFGTQRWTNRLNYSIGKIRLNMVNRLSREDDGLNEFLLFRILRDF